MNDRKLFMLGTCLTTDIVLHNWDIFSPYFKSSNVQWKWYRLMTNKTSVMNEKPGPMGARLQEEMHYTINNNKCSLPISRIYHSIARQHSLEEMLKTVNPGDLLLIDFHADMYPTYYDGADEFEVQPVWRRYKSYFPKWLVDKIDSFPTYQADMISINEVQRRNQNTITATTMLTEKFGTNIITIGSVYNRKIYMKELSAVAESLVLKDYNFSIPFITMTALGDEDHVNFEYFERMYAAVDRDVRRYCPNWTRIIPDKTMCFSDPNHEYGPHPCHLHSLSMQHLRNPLSDALLKLTSSSTIIV